MLLGTNSKRIGRFMVDMHFFHDLREPQEVNLFQGMVVLAVNQPLNMLMREYVAACSAFREVEAGFIPTYRAYFFRGSAMPYWVEEDPDKRMAMPLHSKHVPAPPGAPLGRLMTAPDGAVAYSSAGRVYDWLPAVEAWVCRGEPDYLPLEYRVLTRPRNGWGYFIDLIGATIDRLCWWA